MRSGEPLLRDGRGSDDGVSLPLRGAYTRRGSDGGALRPWAPALVTAGSFLRRPDMLLSLVLTFLINLGINYFLSASSLKVHGKRMESVTYAKECNHVCLLVDALAAPFFVGFFVTLFIGYQPRIDARQGKLPLVHRASLSRGALRLFPCMRTPNVWLRSTLAAVSALPIGCVVLASLLLYSWRTGRYEFGTDHYAVVKGVYCGIISLLLGAPALVAAVAVDPEQDPAPVDVREVRAVPSMETLRQVGAPTHAHARTHALTPRARSCRRPRPPPSRSCW